MQLSRAFLIAAACSALFLAGCSTTQTRIKDRPDLFQTLSAQDQALVQQGEIRVGMPMNGVWLAWGEPNQKGAGRNGPRPIETWIYWGTTDAGYGPFYGGYGMGYGGYGYLRRGGFHHRGFYYDPFYDPFFYSHMNIVQYPERFVSFENGRVVAYSHLPAPRVF
ncbi:MAG: hypothetical protein ACJ8I9_03905 [Chthoniobacterales bacterium]